MPEFDAEKIDISDPRLIHITLGAQAYQGALHLRSPDTSMDKIKFASGEVVGVNVIDDGVALFKNSDRLFTDDEICRVIDKTAFLYRMPDGWRERVVESLRTSKTFLRSK